MAQKKVQKRDKASKAFDTFDAGEYFTAITMFKEAYDYVKDKERKALILFSLGECFRITGDPLKAEMWFKKAIEKNYQNPLVFLYYADALKINQKYDDAIDNYKKYKDLVPDDVRGENGITACENAPKWLENNSGYIVEDVKPLNSKSRDYCPGFAKDDYSEIIFTSSRESASGTPIHGATGQGFTDLYDAKLDHKSKWSTPVPLPPGINTDADEGCPSFNSDYSTMYYTVCKMVKGRQMGCQIYKSSKSGETWGKGELIKLDKDSITYAQAAISPDELTLYFVSDMDGGIGGKDIWKVTRKTKSDEWSKPENLGNEINTPGNEMFPYVHPDGTLYFSSDGQVSIGGLDIFKAKKTPDGHWKIENMKAPINSVNDDFGIVFEKKEEKGYFSSDRNGKGDDDIYAFVLPPLKFNISGVIKDEKSDAPIPQAMIRAIGSDGGTMEFKSSKDGSFKFMLKPSTDYVFVVSSDGYLNGKERETTKGLEKSKDFKTTIYLASIAKPIELPNIFYDFDKADLRPESMVALDKLIETLTDNPTITIELGAHTDARGSDEHNNKLSQNRAQSVVNYLIQKGIAADRLSAKGYGKVMPKIIDKKMAEQYNFMAEGKILNEEFISGLTPEQQEISYQANRRTEFKVLRTDYIPKQEK